MLLKFSEMIGLPIISVSTNEKLGTVRDILFKIPTKEICALIILNKKFMSSLKVVKIKDVINIGKSAVLIQDDQCIMPSKRYFTEVNDVKRYGDEVVEKQIYTDNGIDLGIIQDITFDFETGMLEEFEISDGLVQDLIDGRKMFPVSESIQIEQGIVIVESEKLHALKETQRGLKKLLLERTEETK